jgi:pilus assembly protein Flp/PilA
MLEFTQAVWARVISTVAVAREREEGQTLVEYALIIALVSVGLITALTTLRGQIEGVFTTIGTALAGA